MRRRGRVRRRVGRCGDRSLARVDPHCVGPLAARSDARRPPWSVGARPPGRRVGRCGDRSLASVDPHAAHGAPRRRSDPAHFPGILRSFCCAACASRSFAAASAFFGSACTAASSDAHRAVDVGAHEAHAFAVALLADLLAQRGRARGPVALRLAAQHDAPARRACSAQRLLPASLGLLRALGHRGADLLACRAIARIRVDPDLELAQGDRRVGRAQQFEPRLEVVGGVARLGGGGGGGAALRRRRGPGGARVGEQVLDAHARRARGLRARHVLAVDLLAARASASALRGSSASTRRYSADARPASPRALRGRAPPRGGRSRACGSRRASASSSCRADASSGSTSTTTCEMVPRGREVARAARGLREVAVPAGGLRAADRRTA